MHNILYEVVNSTKNVALLIEFEQLQVEFC